MPAARQLLEHPGLRETEEIQTRLGYLTAKSTVLRAEGDLRGALDVAVETLAARGDVGHTYLAVKLPLVAALEAAFDLGETEKRARAPRRDRGASSRRAATAA